jgi:hypothetical protein
LAENDTIFPGALAIENFNLLASRQVSAQLWINSPSPLYPERFWRINHLSRTDSEVIYNAIKSGGYLDEQDFLLLNPMYSSWKSVIPDNYTNFLPSIMEQMNVAYAGHAVMSIFNDKILTFFEDPKLVIPHPPVIEGFTPAGGTPKTVVTINGKNFTNIVEVRFNGVEATFQPISTTTLLAFVPEGAGSGPITVVNSAGSATSSADFTVDGPVITGVSPGSGIPGTTVTIEGNGFAGISSVTFNGSEASFQPISSSRLLAFVPQGASTGPIAITNSVGTATSSTAFVIEGSVITGFTPGTGVPGTLITINGQNFTEVSAVRFNGTSATILGSLPTQILATVPAAATTGPIEVVTSLGSALSSTDFTVLTPAVIAGFAPAKGPLGTKITLTGQFFTGATAVEFSGVAASFTVASDTQIVTTVPAGTTRFSRIKVTTPAGGTTAPGTFTVTTR